MYCVVYVHFVGVLKTQFMKKCTDWKTSILIFFLDIFSFRGK